MKVRIRVLGPATPTVEICAVHSLGLAHDNCTCPAPSLAHGVEIAQLYELSPGPILDRPWSLALPLEDGRVVVVDLDGLDVLDVVEDA